MHPQLCSAGGLARAFAFLLAVAPCVSQVRTAPNPPKQATLDGDVAEAFTGAPLAGVPIKIYRTPEDDPIFLKSNAEGKFHLPGTVPAGSYYLDTYYPGYVKPSGTLDLSAPRPGIAPRVIPPHSASFTKVEKSVDPEGNVHGTAHVKLARYVILSGKITDGNGEPVQSGYVYFFHKRAPQPGTFSEGILLPDGQRIVQENFYLPMQTPGEYRWSKFEPGIYYVGATGSSGGQSAREPDAIPRLTYYGQTTDLAKAKPIELPQGGAAQADIRIMRQAGVRLSGQVVAAAGVSVPLDSVLVELNPDYPSVLPSWRSAVKDGKFQFDNLLPGRYDLALSGQDFGASQQVQVPSGGLDNVIVELRPLRDLHGTVTFAPGCATGQVHLYAFGSTSARRNRADVETHGPFKLTGLLPGRLRINLFVRQYTRHASAMTLGEKDVLNQLIDYPPAGDEPLNITIGCAADGSER